MDRIKRKTDPSNDWPGGDAFLSLPEVTEGGEMCEEQ